MGCTECASCMISTPSACCTQMVQVGKGMRRPAARMLAHADQFSSSETTCTAMHSSLIDSAEALPVSRRAGKRIHAAAGPAPAAHMRRSKRPPPRSSAPATPATPAQPSSSLHTRCARPWLFPWAGLQLPSRSSASALACTLPAPLRGSAISSPAAGGV